MRILYLSTSYVPYGRADSIQVIKMCQAFAQNGHQVMLVAKTNKHRREPVADFLFYGIEPTFSIKKLARPSVRGGGVVFTANVAYQLWKIGEKFDLIYSRDFMGGWLATKLGYPVVFEAHGFPPDKPVWRKRYQQMISAPSFLRLVVISEGLKHDLAQEDLLPNSDKVVIAHDAADPPVLPENGVARQDGRYHAGYVGHLYPGKGMEIIVQLAQKCPDHVFDVVGGEPHDLEYWRAQTLPDNLKLHGFVNPADLGMYYRTFDVLLLPPQEKVLGASRTQDISRWMSPMKMFEYMATGKPILSSDLPVLTEVLVHEKNALLVPPNDIVAWEKGLMRLLSDQKMANELGRNARQDVLTHYTWQARARKVLENL